MTSKWLSRNNHGIISVKSARGVGYANPSKREVDFKFVKNADLPEVPFNQSETT